MEPTVAREIRARRPAGLAFSALLLFAGILLAAFPAPARGAEPGARTVRVAAFYFPPALFQDGDGTVRGWYVDLLDEVGAREQLHFEYVYGTWAEGLDRARRGEVDLLTSVARTDARDSYLSFGNVPILTVWGELFVHEASAVDGILQLEGKSVAVMRSDFNGQAFREMAGKFGIACRFVEMDSFEEVFRAIDARQVDAGVISRLVGAARQRSLRVKPTGIIFNPFDIFFAAPRGGGAGLLVTLDRTLTEWRRDKTSIYYRSREKWFARGEFAPREFPAWLGYALGGLGAAGAVGAFWVFTLRRQVRRAAEQVRVSEGRFRTAVEEAPFPILIHAEDGEVLTVNRAWRELTGYSHADLPTIAAWTARAYGDGREQVETQIRRLYTLTERVQEGEYVITCRDGSQRTWDFSSMAMGTLPDGRRMAISMANDITHRKLAKQALMESEERLRLALAAAGQGLYDLDLRTGEAIVNADYALMLGYDPADFHETNAAWRDRLHPDDREPVTRVYQDYVAGRRDEYRVEFRQRTRQGDWKWILSLGRIVERDDEGNPLRMLGTHTDITAAKNAETELRLNEARLQAILSISQHRADDLHALLDYALLEALGLSGSRFGYIYHYDEESRQFTLSSWSDEVMAACTIVDKQTVYELDKTGLWGEAVRQRRPIVVNDFHATNPLKKGYPEGHAPLARFLTVPVFSGERIVAVVGVANKPAPYTRADVLQLTLFMDGLWKVVERRQAEVELQAKTAEMERFLYTVSHDLKSPVVTIKGFLDLLEMDLGAGDAQGVERDLGFLHSAADRMARLLEEVLELSRIGRVVYKTEEVSFTDLVNEAASMVGGMIAQRKVEIVVAPSPLLLRGDRNRLVELWQNLVENAVKYMGDQPAPRIDIGLEEHGEEIVFFVRDNGIGIDPRFQEKIFGLFDKLDPGSDGTGLGLALAKRIVETCRGRIWVESAGEGQGSCFHFTLPAVVAQTRGES